MLEGVQSVKRRNIILRLRFTLTVAAMQQFSMRRQRELRKFDECRIRQLPEQPSKQEIVHLGR